MSWSTTHLPETSPISITDTPASDHHPTSETGPSRDTLGRLVAALDVPVDFLTAGDVDEIPVDAISFRAISKLTAGQRDTARSAGRIALLLAEWIEQRFHLPEAQVPSLPTLDPETAAEVVRARWGLGVAPLGNLVRLLEAHGVRVFSLAAECAAVDAFSFFWHQTPYVLLNTAKSGERGRFDAAHPPSEPDGITREPHLRPATVHQSGRAAGAGPADIARDLHLTVAELNRHVFGLVPTAIDGGTVLTPPRRPKLTLITD